VACGAVDRETVEPWGLASGPQGIRIDRETYQTNVPAVFAAGNAIRGRGMVVRSVADGREAALAIDQYLAGRPVVGRHKPFSVRLGKLREGEVDQFVALAGNAPKIDSDRSFDAGEAVAQAGRCLRCDCRALDSCHLRRYAERYGADPNRFKAERKTVRLHDQHGQVLYEPGKCIDCGLCIQIVEAAGEPLGLAFVGRGFDVRIGVPFDRSLEEALGKTALECVAACPTAAMSLKDGVRGVELPILVR
jgi:ferredoxin